jgi:hypothetical protein
MKCTFCLGSFKSLTHNRANCSRAEDTKRLFLKANRNWRREFIKSSKKIGFGVGCLMKLKHFGYWDPVGGWSEHGDFTFMVSGIPWDGYSFMCGYDGAYNHKIDKSFAFISGNTKGNITTLDCNMRNIFSKPEDWPKPYLFDGAMRNPSIPEITQKAEINPPDGWLLGDWAGIDWLVEEYSYDRLVKTEIIRLAEDWANLKEK